VAIAAQELCHRVYVSHQRHALSDNLSGPPQIDGVINLNHVGTSVGVAVQDTGTVAADMQ